MGEERGCIGSWCGNRREGDQWGDLGVDGMWVYGLDIKLNQHQIIMSESLTSLISSEPGPLVKKRNEITGHQHSENRNDPFGSIN